MKSTDEAKTHSKIKANNKTCMQSQLFPHTPTQTAWTGLNTQTEGSPVGGYVKLSNKVKKKPQAIN